MVQAAAPLTPAGDAVSALLRLLAPLGVEEVAAADAAGRVLGAAVETRWDLPSADTSSMDGWAVRSADVVAGAELPVAGESRAGRAVDAALRSGTAMRIFTGAVLPSGADVVVRQEDCTRDGDAVGFGVPVTAGMNVRMRGEDARAGAVMLEAGRRLRATDISVALAAGAAVLQVHRRPRVAIVTTGDELVAAGETPGPGQVVESTSAMLAAAVREAGGEPRLLGPVADDLAPVVALLHEAAADADLVITTAGVSVGDHDHVRHAVEQHGRVEVWRVAMRPGMPVLIGAFDGTPLLGLPGNPVSSAVTFRLFGRPALLALQGCAQPLETRIAVRCGEIFEAPQGLETWLRVRVERVGDDGLPVVVSAGLQTSGAFRSLAAADALLCVPAGVGRLEAGVLAQALPL